MSESLDPLFDALAELVAQKVVDKLRAGDMPGYVDQASSPLGRRRHISAIRQGKLPGLSVGRRYLARVTDVEAYVTRRPPSDVATSSTSRMSCERDIDALAAKLGLVPQGRGRGNGGNPQR